MPANKLKATQSHTEALLQQLKLNFLEDLPDRYNRIEDGILQLRDKPDSLDNYDDLYRNVHSLKGTAGTFGAHAITRICHQLEDLLRKVHSEKQCFDVSYTDLCLQYIDLIKQTHAGLTAKIPADANSPNTELESALERLRQKSLQDNLSCLTVLGTKLMNNIFQDTLQELPVYITIADNGFDALNRLLHEKFDFIAIGNELKLLNGMAVIAALRASDCVNHAIPILMVTTKTQLKSPTQVVPDYVVPKDQQISKNLIKAVQHIIHLHRGQRQ